MATMTDALLMALNSVQVQVNIHLKKEKNQLNSRMVYSIQHRHGVQTSYQILLTLTRGSPILRAR